MKRSIASLFALTMVLTMVRIPAASAAALSSQEVDELETSYNRLTSEFYKKIEPQALFDGVRMTLIAFLQKNGIASPVIPIPKATDDAGANLRELDKELSSVVAQYGNKFGSRVLTYEAIAGLLASVKDKYTVFLSPKEYAALNAGLDGQSFSGVGISIAVDEDTKLLRVNEVIPGGPAEKAGVLADDIITLIDGKPTKGLTTDQDSLLLRGKKGTVVRITIQRGDQTIAPIAIVRNTIHSPSVFARLLPNGIGYTRLTVFGQSTAEELSSALARLEGQGAKAFILDLRDNGGGYLNSAIDVSSKFVPDGPIVSVESRASNITTFDAENTAIAPHPLAVLVNKYTASASEITASAIQDSGVGTLIGNKTYGKGVVQTIFPLPDGSAVKITTARYLTPRNRDINQVGVQPDILSDQTKGARPGDPKSDTQLQAAISFLQQKLTALNSGG